MHETAADSAATSVHDSLPDRPCPCGRDAPYGACCEPVHVGEAAPTAERLMRSRYSAFALGLEAYLLSSWHPSTRPAALELDADTVWQRLIIEQTERGGPFDATGTVTFTAVARTPAGRHAQRERSRFVREAGRWTYVDGDVLVD